MMRHHFCIFLWLLAASAAFSQSKPPLIVFDSISKDLGKVTQGQAAKGMFVFSNRGSGMLEITDIGTS
jgi:hypothetical protein